LISAFRRAGSFRGDAQVTTWMHRIVVNACLDRMRRRRTHATDALPEDEDRLGALAEADESDPAETSERRADVMAALAKLPDEQRAALVLIDMEGYSVEEAAQILDCAPGTVKSRCSRGRARLVPLLTQYRRDVRNQADDTDVTSLSTLNQSVTYRQADSGGTSP
jgi:RNA polymerase sigma-70 factor (ECF subfamily)